MFTFPCISFQQLPLFEDEEKNKACSHLQRYDVVIDVSYLPLNLPCTTQVEEIESATYNDFSNALKAGLAISVSEIHYDEETNHVTLQFDDNSTLQGVIPFENTYEIIKKYITCSARNDTQYLGLAIMTGVRSRFW